MSDKSATLDLVEQIINYKRQAERKWNLMVSQTQGIASQLQVIMGVGGLMEDFAQIMNGMELGITALKARLARDEEKIKELEQELEKEKRE